MLFSSPAGKPLTVGKAFSMFDIKGGRMFV